MQISVSKYFWIVCIYYLRTQGRGSELRNNGGQQSTGVRNQMWRKQLHLLPQTLPHRQHDNHQHLLQYLPKTGHPHQVFLRLTKNVIKLKN